MGRSQRPRPRRLAGKLQQIRSSLGLTQQEMFERLGNTGTKLYTGHIGLYETDRREPPLLVLLQYARLAGVPMEVLVDDELDLPKRLPGSAGHAGARPPTTAKLRRR